MKSRISFFDAATFKKDISRFMPLWALYTVFLLLCMLPTSTGATSYYHPARAVAGSLEPLTFANFLYGMLAAQLLFGELFNSRLCNALHAMPVTRQARFGSHILAGLAFSWIPNLLTTLLMMPTLGHLWYTALLWLAAYSLQYLFFFGAAVFSAMCAGSRFAMVLVYGIINFLSMVIYWFVDTVYLPMMPGVELSGRILELFFPLGQMLSVRNYWEVSYLATSRFDVYYPANATFEGLGDSWTYLFIVSAVGVGAMVAAFFLYRRRKLESAGDFIAVKWAEPIFLVLYTLCAAAFLTIFGELFGDAGYSFFLILGIFLGFFTGKMLLERTTRVFRKKNFLMALVLVAALILSSIPIQRDWFGIVSYVPEAEDVEYVNVYGYQVSRHDISDPEKIALVCQIHENAIANLDHENEDFCSGAHYYTHLEYHLKDGRTVSRRYHICIYSAAAKLWEQLIDTK